jgi:hypothetical protein
MDTVLWERRKFLIEIELPNSAKSIMDNHLSLPKFMNPRMLIELPIILASNTECLWPHLLKVLTDSCEPTVHPWNALTRIPVRIEDAMDRPEPNLLHLLKDRLLPVAALAKTDM